MRVLHVSAYFAPAWDYGGPPRSMLGLCQALRHRGVDARVFTTTACGNQPDLPVSSDWEDESGVPVRRFKRSLPKRFFGSRTLRSALRREGASFDLIHVNGLWNATASGAMREATLLGRCFVVSPRGMLEPGALRTSALRKRLAWRVRERRRLQAAALIHASSQAEARSVKRQVSDARIVSIPLGIDPASLRAERGRFRAAHGIDPHAPLVVFLGRQHRIKRLDLLATAFGSVVASHTNARLVIAGPEEEAPSKATEAALAGVARATIRPGALDAVGCAELLADATVLVSCSDSESFGMSIVEALAAGVPVVATKTTPWEVLQASGCGYWVEQEGDAIAQGIARVLGDDARRASMRSRGPELVARRFSWDAVGAQMVAAYKDVLER